LPGADRRPPPPNLNARGQSFGRQDLRVDQPILAGRRARDVGRRQLAVTGPDMVAGAKVRVAAVDGTELKASRRP